MLLSLLFTRDDDDQQEFYRKSYLLSFTSHNRGSLSQARPVTCDDLLLLIKRPDADVRCQIASLPRLHISAWPPLTDIRPCVGLPLFAGSVKSIKTCATHNILERNGAYLTFGSINVWTVALLANLGFDFILCCLGKTKKL